MTQLAKMLGFGISDTAVQKWEKDQNRPTEEHRKRIVEFLGFNPTPANPTGDSCRVTCWDFITGFTGRTNPPPFLRNEALPFDSVPWALLFAYLVLMAIFSPSPGTASSTFIVKT